MRAARESAGMTKADLAGAAGVGVGTVERLERGDLTVWFTDAWKIAHAMGRTLDDLVGRTQV